MSLRLLKRISKSKSKSKIACSKYKQQTAPPFDVLINNGANQLLLDLVLDEEAYRNVYNFLRTIVKRAGAETEQEEAPYHKAQQERQQQQIQQQHHPVSQITNLDCTEHGGYLVMWASL